MLKIITHRSLGMNILIAFVLAVVLFAVFILSLKVLTHHGRSRSVPMVVGKTYEEAERILEKEGFDIVIQDSVYIDSLPPMAVVKQVPESDAVVKVNRTVYLTLNRSMAPMIDMPNLIGFSYRNAIMNLSSVGLSADTTYRSDFAKNSVLEQLYKGNSIAPGTKIQMGSSVTLVLGTGVGEYQFNVPNLVGMTFGEARGKLEQNGLSILIAQADPSIKDTLNAFIFKQDPPRFDEDGKPLRIRTGQLISVWLSLERPVSGDTTSINQQP